MIRPTQAAAAALGLATMALLGACSPEQAASPEPPASAPQSSGTPEAATTAVPSPSTSVPGSASASASSDDVGLPPPPAPSTPAPSTAGGLSQASLPVPSGWKAVARKGGVEEGYLGNGTPARARDPRRAAFEVMSVGCAAVDREAWTDPREALEVNLAKGSRTGVAEVMTFASPAQASTWFGLWTKQVEACLDQENPRTTKTSADATSWLGTRSYGSADSWTELGAVNGATVRLYLLQDAAAALTPAQQQALLEQVKG